VNPKQNSAKVSSYDSLFRVFEEEDYTSTIYYLRVCICSFLELSSVFPAHVARHLLQLVVSAS